jgi:hypothetical protein
VEDRVHWRRLPLAGRRRRRWTQPRRPDRVLLSRDRQHARDGAAHPGLGSQCANTEHDSTGEYLDGARDYALTLPPGVPAKDFWSIVVYDPQTRSELQTGQPFPSKNNTRDPLAANTDGSITLTFGPTERDEKPGNWIQTVSGKKWFTILRLYGPLAPWFDKTWVPGEIEPLDAE